MGVLGVGRQLAPAMPGQHAVDARQGDGLAQLGFNLGLEPGNHHDATARSLIQHLVQNLRLARQIGVRPVAQIALAAWRLHRPVGDFAKTGAQGAGGGHATANGLSGLLQTQAQFQRQQHRLGLPQLIRRLCAPQQGARRFHVL